MKRQNGNDVAPLAEFLASVRAAQYDHYAARSGALVADTDAFAEMKAYILHHYEHIDIGHVNNYSVDAAGSVFDCLPESGSANSPPTPPRSANELIAGERLVWQNPVTTCPPGTIPVQRVTLETLVRFPHLRDFFQK